MVPLFDNIPHKRSPVVTGLLIVACIGVMTYESALDLRSPPALDQFVHRWGLVPASLWSRPGAEGWLTVLTSMFLHAGWLHLLGNCWFLWIFGNNVEDRLGHVAYVPFYVLSGLGAAVVQVAAGPGSLVPMVGASGAISGVLGAYLRMFPKAWVYAFTGLWFAPVVPIPAAIYIALWFAFQFWQGVGSVFAVSVEGGVAWWAHVGGFCVGFVLAPRLAPARKRPAS